MNTDGGTRGNSIHYKLILIILGILIGGCHKKVDPVSICDLQGEGNVSPLYGQNVIVNGIVSVDLQNQSPAGFYIQNDDCQTQNNNSRGVFILAEYDYDLVSLGDELTLQGYVFEYSRETYLLLQENSIKILSVDNPIPDPLDLESKLRISGSSVDYESWEGMLVFLSSTIVMNNPENDGTILVLPIFDEISKPKINTQLSLNDALKINIRTNQGRLRMAQKGDILEELSGVLRQDDNFYKLYLINSDQVKLIPANNHQIDEVNSEEESITGFQAGQVFDTLNTPLPTITPYPVDLLLIEIFPNPTGKEPEGEWIEIYNPSQSAIPLSGVKIGDETSRGGKEGMLRFPDGYYIKANDVLVIANNGNAFRVQYGFPPDFEMEDSDVGVPNLLPYDSWGGEKVQLSNSGDEVILLDPWDQIVDSIGYGNAKNSGLDSPVQSPKEGHSLERYPPERDRDKASDWREKETGSPGNIDRSPPTQVIPPSPSPIPTQKPSPYPTFTPTLEIPSPTPVWVDLLFTEVMFNPTGEEPGGEWFEIFNPEDIELPLRGVKVGDAAISGDPEGMYTFPIEEMIPSGGIILVANRGDSFETQYGFYPDYELINTDPSVKDLTSYDRWAGGPIRLGNQGDELILMNGWDDLVDSLSYGDSNYQLFQPPVPIGPEGSSLARYPMDYDNDMQSDWIISKNPSPGKINMGLATQTPTSIPIPTLTPTSSATSSPVPILPTISPTITFSATMTVSLTNTVTESIPTSSSTITPLSSSTGLYTPQPSQTPSPIPALTNTLAILTFTPTLEMIEDEVLILNEIHSDPHPILGDANNDGSVHSDDDEFLEFINKGEDTLDLSGWQIRDGIKTRWTFPADTILPGKGVVLIFGGGLPTGDFGGSLVHIASTLGLNNSGDTISVLDETGSLKMRIRYGSEGNHDQSLTRNPDLHGSLPFLLHSDLPDANGSLYSPGTKIDGTRFEEE